MLKLVSVYTNYGRDRIRSLRYVGTLSLEPRVELKLMSIQSDKYMKQNTVLKSYYLFFKPNCLEKLNLATLRTYRILLGCSSSLK